MRIQGHSYFENQELEQIQSRVENRVNNIFKKVKFYQSKSGDGSYIIPTDLK